jgi:hypothetical protein
MKWRVVLGIVLLSHSAWADDFPMSYPTSVPGTNDIIVPLKKGYPAPFDGQLFNNDTAIRWGIWIKETGERTKAEMDKQKALCTAQMDYKSQIAEIEAEKLTTVNQDLMNRLKLSETARVNAEYQLANPPWYKSPLLYFALGVGAAAGVLAVAHSVK